MRALLGTAGSLLKEEKEKELSPLRAIAARAAGAAAIAPLLKTNSLSPTSGLAPQIVDVILIPETQMDRALFGKH